MFYTTDFSIELRVDEAIDCKKIIDVLAKPCIGNPSPWPSVSQTISFAPALDSYTNDLILKNNKYTKHYENPGATQFVYYSNEDPVVDYASAKDQSQAWSGNLPAKLKKFLIHPGANFI